VKAAAVAATAGVVALALGFGWWRLERATPVPVRTATGTATTAGAASAAAVDAVDAAAPDPVVMRDALTSPTGSRPARDWRPFVLNVVAAEDGAPLAGVRVVRPGQSIDEFMQSSARLEPLLGALQAAEWRGDSPLRIEPRADEPLRLGRHEVGAAGRETVRLRIDFASGGERHVALRPAGSLRVTLADAFPGMAAHWRLFELANQFERIERRVADARRDRSPAAAARVTALRGTLDWLRGGDVTAAEFVEFGVTLAGLEPDRDIVAAHAEPLELDDLAAGHWRIACFVDALPGAPLVATGEAWIEAGAAAAVELAYAAPQLLAPVECHGVVEFATAAAGDGAASDRLPGRIALAQSIPRGLGRLESNWNADLGAAAGKDEIPFTAGRAWPGTLHASSDDGLWQGEAQVAATGEPLRLLLRPTPRRIGDDASRPPATLVLTLVDGATVIPGDAAHSVSVAGAAGRVELLRSSGGDDDPARWLEFDHAGAVRLTVHDVAGYLPSEAVAVELVPGATVEVTVPLRRRS